MPDPRSIDNVKIGCLSIGCLRILKKVVDRSSAHRKYTNTGVPVLTEPNKEGYPQIGWKDHRTYE